MIASSNRFASSGGGGGGGANREIVFSLKVRDGGMSRELDAIGKKFDELARKAANIQVGMAGGGVPSVSGGTVSGGVALSGRAVGRAAAPRAPNYERAERDWQRSQKQQWTAYERAERGYLADKARQTREFKAGLNDAIEGVTSLARAFVLLGVSSEENMVKAVRALAKFEAAAQGVRGVMKVTGPLGSLLTRGGGAMGLKAGGSAGAVGAAGLAAGVGIVGGGLAIADQIRYSRTGEIGAFSQAHASMGTSAAGWLKGLGVDPRRGGAATWGGRMMFGGIPDLLNYSGYYNKSDSDAAYARQLMEAGGTFGGLAERGAFDLANARGDLANTERMYARQGMRRAYATEFQGLSRGGQRRLLRMRDRYLDNPDAMKSRDLLRIRGALGPAEQEGLDARLEGRSGDLFARGFDDLGGRSVPPIKLDEVLFKREVTAKLEIQNEAVVKRMEDLLKEVVKLGNEDLQDRFEKMIAGVQANIDNTNTNFQNSQNTIGNLRGY